MRKVYQQQQINHQLQNQFQHLLQLKKQQPLNKEEQKQLQLLQIKIDQKQQLDDFLQYLEDKLKEKKLKKVIKVEENWKDTDWASNNDFQEAYKRIYGFKRNNKWDLFFWPIVLVLILFCFNGIKKELSFSTQQQGRELAPTKFLDSVPEYRYYKEVSYVVEDEEVEKEKEIGIGTWTAKYSFRKLSKDGIFLVPARPGTEVSIVLVQVPEPMYFSPDTVNEIGTHMVLVSFKMCRGFNLSRLLLNIWIQILEFW
ncbi:putative RNase III [Tieghemostelium lacteum]|uniref:Putative RNase III n=1 Tax=Tieghemostelium lacteum TaxID=361077 RepID=A0A152AAB7_TIELA|nr:putative RNase III [Tieghemostelium lacteum]|eukprot:KYR03172.1 putative RNase III [Tieghemostelium lacteum]